MRKYKDLELKTLEKMKSLIKAENLHQLRKWGIQERTLPEWILFLGEEVGELCEAVAEFEYREGTSMEIIQEAIQVATLALKIAEMVTYPFGCPSKPVIE